MDENQLKLEMRLQAIEHLLTNAFVQFYRYIGAPTADVKLAHEQQLNMLAQDTYPSDPATSDMVSDEMYQAVKRLLEMQMKALEELRNEANPASR